MVVTTKNAEYTEKIFTKRKREEEKIDYFTQSRRVRREGTKLVLNK
jgi:hypothetical protein